MDRGVRPIGDWSMAMTLSRYSSAFDRLAGAGIAAGAVQLAGQLLQDDAVDQRTLAGAGNAGDAGHDAERDADVDMLQVVLRGAAHDQPMAVARLGGQPGCRSGSWPLRYWPVIEAGVGHDLVGCAGGDDIAAVLAGAGSHVDDVVGCQHGLLVMLDDQDRVAEVAQALQRAQQPRVVALVQADARFVQDIEDAHQAGADLGRQADALGFAAGQGGRRPRQGHVVQSDIDQEAEAGVQFLADLRGDARPAAASGSSCVRKSRAWRIGSRVSSWMFCAADLDGQALRLQAGALADRAGRDRHDTARNRLSYHRNWFRYNAFPGWARRRSSRCW